MWNYATSRVKPLNEDIVNGLASQQLEQVEYYIDWYFRCSAKNYPDGIKYKGGTRCTPKETFLEVTKGAQPTRYFEMSRSDVFLMRYEFEFNNKPLAPRHIFLPFCNTGGIMFLRDTQYAITPVISGKVFNVEQGNIYLPSTRLRMGFWQRNTSCICNNMILNQYAVGSHLYKISPEAKRSKLNPLLIHYILAKYGLTNTLKFYNVNAIFGGSELDDLNMDEYLIFKSRQIIPKNKNIRDYPPSQLRIAIKKEEYYTLLGNIVSAIFYIVDNATTATSNFEDLDNPRLWLRLLDFFIFKDQTVEFKMKERMERHLESMESTIDAIAIHTLEKANINCKTIFELFRYLTLYFQDICIHYDFGTMYDLQINTVEPLTFGIRKDIFNAMYQLQKIPPEKLNEAKINFTLSHTLKRDRILSPKGHGELESASIASTCLLYGPTIEIITHGKATSTNGNGNKDLNDPGMLMHPSILEVSSFQACTGKEPTGRGILNPHQKFSKGYITTPNPEYEVPLKKLKQLLKRG